MKVEEEISLKERTEGKEKFLYPGYLEMNKDLIIPNDTETVYLILQVVNIRKVSYTLVKNYKVWDSTPYPYKITQIVSISKQPNRMHQILLPYKKGYKVDFGLQLFDEKGSFIMDIGQAKYTVEGGGLTYSYGVFGKNYKPFQRFMALYVEDEDHKYALKGEPVQK